jgi:acetoacetyl-CoA synthetase
VTDGEVVWRPDAARVENAEITSYLRWLATERGLEFGGYTNAWRWSVSEPGAFWDSIWQYEAVVGERGHGSALADERMPGARWFEGARLNYAENLLSADRDGSALIAVDEEGGTAALTRGQIAEQAGALAATLRAMGVGVGDRVVAYVHNIPQAVIGLVATASIGAVWSICSPDFGTAGVVTRFRQLSPKVLLAVDGYRFNDKAYRRGTEVAEIVAGLPSLEHVIWIDALEADAPATVSATTWTQATAEPAPLSFERVAFDHPLWVLFSSGTTGNPKGIVHGHGGIVLEHRKLMRLGFDLGPGDRLLMLASTTWMVWNLLVSALLTATTAVLLDGSPAGNGMRRVWRVIDDLDVTVLGAGAGFVHATMKAGVVPRAEHELARLSQVMATGSPLSPQAYRWIADAVGEHVWINSASGGTDVCSALVGGCVLLPVRAGRLQAPGLGVAAEAWDGDGRPVVGQTGELVITRPMPSMPLCLWDDDGRRLRESYFAVYPGVWRHGDFIEFDADGSSIIHGRSDATLNRNGIRMGSAEIYAIVEALPDVSDSLVIGVECDGDEGYYMPLFITLAPGADEDTARTAVVDAIRRGLSPRHVPDEVVVAPGIPHTRTGKKLEVPVKRLLQGADVHEVLDPSSVDAPEVLGFFARFAADRGAVR